MSTQSCEKKFKFCCNSDLKLCRMKSGRNRFEGEIIWLCRQCRKAENGQFKLVKA